MPLADNFERALQSIEESPVKEGVAMIEKQLNQILTDLGVTEIPSLNQQFDPEIHSAVLHVEDETVGGNTVVECMQKGYMHGNKVLRFAMVKVAN